MSIVIMRGGGTNNRKKLEWKNRKKLGHWTIYSIFLVGVIRGKNLPEKENKQQQQKSAIQDAAQKIA